MRVYFWICLVFISCSSQDNFLPNSVGSDSEIVFVVRDFIWQEKIKNLAIKVFELPIEGLIQEEKSFNIIHVSDQEFNQLLKRHTNIVIINNKIKSTHTKYNQWAKEQMVAYIDWNKDEVKNLEALRKMYKKFKKKELSRLRVVYEKDSWKNVEKELRLNFDIDVIIPKEYLIVEHNNNLFWASYNPPKSEEIKQLLIFSFKPKTANVLSETLTKIDSVFSKHIKGSKENTYVKIETRYSPHYFNNTYRGMWKLENGFMGGPFLAKVYFSNERIIISSGLVFAPQSSKRKYIKEMEIIL